jgi:hypothetical protein
METKLQTSLASIRSAKSRGDAVRRFLAVVDAHAEHIADVKRRVEQVYRFETPDRPVFQYDVTGFEYEKSDWLNVDLDRLLDRGMQGLVFRLEAMPESDFVPLLPTGVGKSDLIPRMFGVTFDYPPDGSVIPQFGLIEELPRDLEKLQGVDVTQTEPWQDVVQRVRFLVEATRGQVEIAYPQMQGPLTNAPRLMDHTEMLIACHADPDSMRFLANTWADVATRLILALQEKVGDPVLLRPRARFYQPGWIRGLIVGDYLALMRPEQYYDICADAWAMVRDRLGPIFYHTCGPVWRSLEVLKKLPGLASFECTFVRGQTGTTADIQRVKERLAGRIVLNHFEWPLDGTVQDTENLTAEWLRDISRGGGFMMQDSGSLEKGRNLFRTLELA